MREEVLEMPEEPTLSKKDGYQFCFQPLFKHKGETITRWKISGKSDGKQKLITSVHHSFPERNSLKKVTQNLNKRFELLQQKQFIKTHQKW